MDKIAKVRARENSANRRENEWRRRFLLMRKHRDALRVENTKLRKELDSLRGNEMTKRYVILEVVAEPWIDLDKVAWADMLGGDLAVTNYTVVDDKDNAMVNALLLRFGYRAK